MANMKKPAPKRPTTKRFGSKPVPMPTRAPNTTGSKMPKRAPKPLTGPGAVAEIQRRVSPSGVKKAESGAKKAIDKKYPGLYKKSK